VQSFRAQPPQAAAVREQLAARYVVSGSVRESGGTLRVSVELADASSGEQLWSEHFGARDAELFNLIDSVVAGIVGRLAVSLADIEQQRAATRPPQSAEAYDLVLRARALMRLEQRVANLEARQLLVLAQQRAPGFAPVWVSAGDAEWQRAAYGWVEDPEASASRAAELARRALTLPDQRSHAQAYSLLSTVAAHQGHLDEALAHSSRALALNPSDGGTLFRHGHALLGLGRVDEAIVAYETLMRYEPRPTQAPRMQMGWAYYVAGRWEQALAYAESEIARSPDAASFHAIRAAALAQLGRLDEARLAANTARRLNPRLDAAQAGSRLRNPAHAALVREGLAKAGL
jgi:adenylate cyclase